MKFDEIRRKASDTLKNEEKTDRNLDSAARFLNDKTAGRHADKVAKGRDFLDDKLGGDDHDHRADRADRADHRPEDDDPRSNRP